MTLGGRGTGGLTSHEIEELRKEARARLEQSRRDSQINSYLQQLLTEFNDRDVEKIGTYLSEIDGALSNKADLERLLFGGSVAKHTHVEGLSDIDALVLLKEDGATAQSASQVIAALKSALDQHLRRGGIASITKGKLAVTVTYDDGTEIQLLPAIRAGEQVSIPSARTDSWVQISPTQFAQRLTEVNGNQGGNVIPTIKLAKALLANRLGDDAPSGYHLEALAVTAFRSYQGPRTPKQMLIRLLDTASTGVLHRLRDFTGQSLYVDEYLGSPGSRQRNSLARRLRQLTRRISTQSLAGWRASFGE